MHAERQAKIYCNDDLNFSEFEVSAVKLHRDPVHYAGMLHIQGDLERENLKCDLENCLQLAVQMDGSVERKQRDKKLFLLTVTLRMCH